MHFLDPQACRKQQPLPCCACAEEGPSDDGFLSGGCALENNASESVLHRSLDLRKPGTSRRHSSQALAFFAKLSAKAAHELESLDRLHRNNRVHTAQAQQPAPVDVQIGSPHPSKQFTFRPVKSMPARLQIDPVPSPVRAQTLHAPPAIFEPPDCEEREEADGGESGDERALLMQQATHGTSDSGADASSSSPAYRRATQEVPSCLLQRLYSSTREHNQRTSRNGGGPPPRTSDSCCSRYSYASGRPSMAAIVAARQSWSSISDDPAPPALPCGMLELSEAGSSYSSPMHGVQPSRASPHAISSSGRCHHGGTSSGHLGYPTPFAAGCGHTAATPSPFCPSSRANSINTARGVLQTWGADSGGKSSSRGSGCGSFGTDPTSASQLTSGDQSPMAGASFSPTLGLHSQEQRTVFHRLEHCTRGAASPYGSTELPSLTPSAWPANAPLPPGSSINLSANQVPLLPCDGPEATWVSDRLPADGANGRRQQVLGRAFALQARGRRDAGVGRVRGRGEDLPASLRQRAGMQALSLRLAAAAGQVRRGGHRRSCDAAVPLGGADTDDSSSSRGGSRSSSASSRRLRRSEGAGSCSGGGSGGVAKGMLPIGRARATTTASPLRRNAPHDYMSAAFSATRIDVLLDQLSLHSRQ